MLQRPGNKTNVRVLLSNLVFQECLGLKGRGLIQVSSEFWECLLYGREFCEEVLLQVTWLTKLNAMTTQHYTQSWVTWSHENHLNPTDWSHVRVRWQPGSCHMTVMWQPDTCHVTVMWQPDSASLVPRSHPKSGKRPGVTCKIPVCAVSAVFVWSRGITFVHYQLLNSWRVNIVDSFQDHLKMGTRLTYFPYKLPISET